MKRPSDQVKLLLVGLIRTASAFAVSSESKVTILGSALTSFSSKSSTSSSSTSSLSAAATSMIHNNNHQYYNPTTTSTTSNNNNNNNNNNNDLSLILRVARLSDVASMSNCNLACLPENYNHAFYANHMKQWPDLAIVAVKNNNNYYNANNSEDDDILSSSRQRKPPHLSYQPGKISPVNDNYSDVGYGSDYDNYNKYNHNNNNHNNNNPNHNVVAYVLGKVEEQPTPVYPNNHDDDSNYRYNDDIYNLMGGRSRPYTTQLVGHVTSLAVLEPYRRQGLAEALMNQLHFHMEQHTPNLNGNTYSSSSSSSLNGCKYCGLHVRISNIAATRLYQKFGYSVTNIIPAYYQDGEDAYYMTKQLNPTTNHHQQQKQQQQRYGETNNNNNHRAGFLGNIVFRRRHNKVQPNNNNQYPTANQSRPWEYGPLHLRLPRPVGDGAGDYENSIDNSSSSINRREVDGLHHEEEEYMTGTL